MQIARTSNRVFDGYENGPPIKDITHQRRGQNREPEYEFQQRADHDHAK